MGVEGIILFPGGQDGMFEIKGWLSVVFVLLLEGNGYMSAQEAEFLFGRLEGFLFDVLEADFIDFLR